MNNKNLNLQSPAELAGNLALRSKALRLQKSWTRQTMSERAGITPSSLKRFENTGKASLELVLKVAHALGRLEEFNQVLLPPVAQSIEELEQRSRVTMRKRGRL